MPIYFSKNFKSLCQKMALSSSTLSIKNLYKKLSLKFELLSSWPQCGGEQNVSTDTSAAAAANCCFVAPTLDSTVKKIAGTSLVT